MSAVRYLSPREFLDYMRAEPRRKARGRFANKTGGRSCLGHYAEACGIPYNPEQGKFRCWPARWTDENAGLPLDHWLMIHQRYLINLNDSEPGFDAALYYIEGLS